MLQMIYSTLLHGSFLACGYPSAGFFLRRGAAILSEGVLTARTGMQL